MRLGFLLVPLLLAVASCTHITKIEPQPQQIGETYTVTPGSAWNGLRRASFGSVAQQWTKDGFLLNGMNFWYDIKEGSALYNNEDVELPKFNANMKATEVQEFFVGSRTAQGSEDVVATNLRPAKFGSAEGFRFDFTFASPEGLKLRGMVLAVVIDEKLQMIEYWATDAHYFEQDSGEAEKIFGSVELI